MNAQTRVSPMPRGKYRGMLQILRFNWPMYVLALLFCSGAIVAVAVWRPHYLVAWMMVAAMGFALCWMLASLAASHWVYDRSGLCDWTWIRSVLSAPPRAWASLHAGLDESSGRLKELFPGSRAKVLDIFDPGEMTEPSIAAARNSACSTMAARADFRALPFARGELDAVFLIFAAHEIRKPVSRSRFFKEINRVLNPGGQVLLVEHLRDWNNFLAFGPGFFHFHSRRTWLNAAGQAGLSVERIFAITPFVGVFVFQKPSESSPRE